MPHVLSIREARSPQEIEAVKGLFVDYQTAIGVDLCFQGFDDELRQLPGDYAAPRGMLVLAEVDGAAAGCCAFRPLLTSDHLNACEMKRLFVREGYRGLGLGRQLVDRIMASARFAGYSTILLDTLSDMEAARALYQELGFYEVPPYYHNPLAGAHYLKAEL